MMSWDLNIWKFEIWLTQEWKELLNWNQKQFSLFHKSSLLGIQNKLVKMWWTQPVRVTFLFLIPCSTSIFHIYVNINVSNDAQEVSIMLQKIMFIIFLIWKVCKRVSFLKFALTFLQYHKNYYEKSGYISCMFYLFLMGPSKLKRAYFNIIIGMEGVTQLLKSNFEWFKCKWRHQCLAYAKKGTFFSTCPITLSHIFWVLYQSETYLVMNSNFLTTCLHIFLVFKVIRNES